LDEPTWITVIDEISKVVEHLRKAVENTKELREYFERIGTEVGG
jgi:hypothetical protein